MKKNIKSAIKYYIMETIKWQSGLKLCVDNAIQLRDDGEMLMERGSYGHAYFSFYTALEELGLAFFILDNYRDPDPQKLKKMIWSKGSHQKKSKLMIFDSFVSKIKDLNLPDNHLKEDFSSREDLEDFYARKLDRGLKIYEKRNYGIYVSLNKGNTDWLTPQDFNPEDVELIHDAVNKRIEEFKSAISFMERRKKRLKRE